MAVIKLNIPKMDPWKVVKKPREASEESLIAAEKEVEEVANKYADHLRFTE